MAKDRKYWNDYLTDIRLQDSGEYDYHGAYYSPDYGEACKKPTEKFAKETAPFAALALVASLLGGLFPATGATDTWYVILPFGLTIALNFVIVYHLGKLIHSMIFGRDKALVREYVYDKTFPRLKPITKGMISVAAITIIAEVFHLVIYGKGSHFGGAVLLLFCMAISALSGVVLLYAFNRVKWLKIAKDKD